MYKKFLLSGIAVVILVVGVLLWKGQQSVSENSNVVAPPVTDQNAAPVVTEVPAVVAPEFASPIDRVSERVTKKPFGIFIDPKTSPVQPERFRGYHTGTDLETFPSETNVDVPIRAVCTGKLTLKRSASGYGGVVAQLCDLRGNPISVIYGHLALGSVDWKVGDQVDQGEEIGILGAGGSADTDGERKHLHLGFFKGSTPNIRGYVASKAELSAWLDPCTEVCKSL